MARRGAGEGTISRRRDGRWQARLSSGYANGKRVRMCFYGASRASVQEQLERAKRDLQLGLPMPLDARLTVEQYLHRWLEDVVHPSVRPSTFRSYELNVRLYIVPDLGRVSLAKLAPQHVQQLLNRKLAEGLSPRSVGHVRAVLRRALNQAYRWDLVSRNVATLVDAPRVPHYEVRSLSPPEARNLLATVRHDRLAALFTVALAVGLRQGEALGLLWEDVDLDAGRLVVRRALQRVDGRLQLVEPKTSRGRRSVDLPPMVVAELRSHRARQLEERLWAGSRWRESGFVFTTTVGSPLDSSNVTHRLQRLLEDAGLPRMRFHDLRHTAASLLLAQGVHPRVVMEILGHSQISLTMNTYSHVIPSLQADAAGRMEQLLTMDDVHDDAGALR